MQQSILALAALELQTAKGLAIFTKEHTGFVQASLLHLIPKKAKKNPQKKTQQTHKVIFKAPLFPAK